MTIPVYTDAASVAAALRMPPDTALVGATSAGATTLQIAANQTATSALYPGMSLALDQFNPARRETVQITAPVTGTGPYAVPVTATVNDHGDGAPVKEASAIADVVSAASRMIDDATYTSPGAFSQQSWTETVLGQGTPDRRLFFEVQGRNITSISSVSWQGNPGDNAVALQPSQCQFDDFQVWVYPGFYGTPQDVGPVGMTPPPFAKHVIVQVTYEAGYSPIPGDLQRAATVLAARLFKAGDTGFSDVLANAEMGLLQYKKGIPGDIAVILRPWRRWA